MGGFFNSMPEPIDASKDGEVNTYSLDKMQPFETQSNYKTPLKNKFVFLVIPVVVGYILVGMLYGCELDGNSTWDWRNRLQWFWLSFWIRCGIKFWFFLGYVGVVWLGAAPQAYATRCWIWYLANHLCWHQACHASPGTYGPEHSSQSFSSSLFLVL